MRRRIVKQTIIGAIFLLILFGLAFAAYYSFIRVGPTCFDGIQNQEEQNVDCGGPCRPCELINIKDLEILSVETISPQSGFYDIVAQIKNPNANYGSGEVPCYFKLYDSSGNIVGQYFDNAFILPNQTKYLIKTKVPASGSVKKTEVSFGEIAWEKLEDYQPPYIAVQRKEYRLLGENELGFSQLRAILINKSNFDFDKVDVDIVLLDSSGRVIAVNTNEIRTFLASQERDFVSTWFNRIQGQVLDIKIEPETNIFNADNYLPMLDGEQERFQEY